MSQKHENYTQDHLMFDIGKIYEGGSLKGDTEDHLWFHNLYELSYHRLYSRDLAGVAISVVWAES